MTRFQAACHLDDSKVMEHLVWLMCHITKEAMFESSMIAYVITNCVDKCLKTGWDNQNLVALVSWFNKNTEFDKSINDSYYSDWVTKTISNQELPKDLYPCICSIIIWN